MLEIEAFRNYLETLDPDDIAGYRGDSEHCPIAEWAGLAVGLFGLNETDDNGFTHELETPDWIFRFVAATDGPDARMRPVRITAREALDTLDAIRRYA